MCDITFENITIHWFKSNLYLLAHLFVIAHIESSPHLVISWCSLFSTLGLLDMLSMTTRINTKQRRPNLIISGGTLICWECLRFQFRPNPTGKGSSFRGNVSGPWAILLASSRVYIKVRKCDKSTPVIFIEFLSTRAEKFLVSLNDK
jgi:hypothetical protein